MNYVTIPPLSLRFYSVECRSSASHFSGQWWPVPQWTRIAKNISLISSQNVLCRVCYCIYSVCYYFGMIGKLASKFSLCGISHLQCGFGRCRLPGSSVSARIAHRLAMYRICGLRHRFFFIIDVVLFGLSLRLLPILDYFELAVQDVTEYFIHQPYFPSSLRRQNRFFGVSSSFVNAVSLWFFFSV